jgi:hypothetical protein
MGLLHYKYRFECIHTGEANIKKKQITKKKQTKGAANPIPVAAPFSPCFDLLPPNPRHFGWVKLTRH